MMGVKCISHGLRTLPFIPQPRSHPELGPTQSEVSGPKKPSRSGSGSVGR